MTQLAPSVFISYSHADKDLARGLADALRGRGVTVWIDEGELKVGDSIIERIATAIAEIDFVLALVSEASRSSNWCRKELALAVTGELSREGMRVLPLRVGGATMPESLLDVYFLDLDSDGIVAVADQVVAAIGEHKVEVGVGSARVARKGHSGNNTRGRQLSPSAESPAGDEPIRISGIVEEGVGQPRGDGTRGSALYRIPLRLSRRPSDLWAKHFVATWDHPPQWTTMHRPGIASVVGDTIVLDGTTIDELERYHVETLRHVLDRVNKDVAEREATERAHLTREAERLRKHEEDVQDRASRIRFD